MRLHIVARGRMPAGPESELVARYLARLGSSARVTELAESATLPAAGPGTITVALDERGELLASAALAERILSWRDIGAREVRFLIGGADGHDAKIRAAADLLLAFGPATWPHLLVRAMLAEQLYRATSILAGHPYHRA